jgi:hypothetical protein
MALTIFERRLLPFSQLRTTIRKVATGRRPAAGGCYSTQTETPPTGLSAYRAKENPGRAMPSDRDARDIEIVHCPRSCLQS